MWHEQLTRLLSGTTPQRLAEFLNAALASHVQFVQARLKPSEGTAPWEKLRWSVEISGGIKPEDLPAWEALLQPYREQYPDASALALYWLCDVPNRLTRVQAAVQQAALRSSYGVDPKATLLALVELHPPLGAADILAGMLADALRHFTANPAVPVPGAGDALTAPVSLLVKLDSGGSDAPLQRGRSLVQQAVDLHAQARKTQPNLARSVFEQLSRKVVNRFVVPLVQAGLLSDAGFDALLREYPDEMKHFGRMLKPEHAPWDDMCRAAIDRFIVWAHDRDPDPNVVEVLWRYSHFHSMDAFLAACRTFQRFSSSKPPVTPWSADQDPTAWAVRLLRQLPKPIDRDLARSAKLGVFPSAVVENATLLAPG